jgi:hypothetical protein
MNDSQELAATLALTKRGVRPTTARNYVRDVAAAFEAHDPTLQGATSRDPEHPETGRCVERRVFVQFSYSYYGTPEQVDRSVKRVMRAVTGMLPDGTALEGYQHEVL